MMGRTTLREIKEALAAARVGQPTPLAVELESLARLLEGEPHSAPAEGASTEDPNQAEQQTGIAPVAPSVARPTSAPELGRAATGGRTG